MERVIRWRAALLGAAVAVSIAGMPARAHNGIDHATGMKTISGATKRVGSSEIKTWAKMNADNKFSEVGVTVPYAVLKNPPPARPMDHAAMQTMAAASGQGDAAAAEGTVPVHPPMAVVCRIPFPAEVRRATYLDHFEMDWNPEGHEPRVFQEPHFDLHFYGVPMKEVDAISTFDPRPPSADRMPPGYIYPGAATFVPKMGVHAIEPAVLEKPFSAVMIAGFDKGRMNFLEPMVTQTFLEEKEPFSMKTPRPKEFGFGRSMLYPTQFRGEYAPSENAYHFVLSEFVPVK